MNRLVLAKKAQKNLGNKLYAVELERERERDRERE